MSRLSKTVSWQQPKLTLMYATPGTQVLGYQDSARLRSRAKPAGAMCLELRIAITDRDDAPLEDARTCALFTKTPMKVHFEPQHNGRAATYYARWRGRNDRTGPWSAPVSMRIAA
jgi:hypothetical protein